MVQTKALYNLIRLNAAEDPLVRVEKWALEDLRMVPFEELFCRLKKANVSLNKESFVQFAEQCDTPEELADLLLPDAMDEEMDPFYLVVFELWRRLVPEKQSLSIFCDEIDHRIALFEQGSLKNDEAIQDILANLLEVLDENADAGAEPKEVFAAISEYSAHDLESFIYDYTAEILDEGNSVYASELIEGFYPFMSDPAWFDLLRARLLAFTDMDESNQIIQQLLKKDLELSLLMEILGFLSGNGKHESFLLAVKKITPLVKEKEEILDICQLTADYFRRLDADAKEQAVLQLMKTDRVNLADLQKLLS